VEEVPPFQPQVYTYVVDVGKRENVYSTAEKVRREVELIERTMVVNCHAHFWVSLVLLCHCSTVQATAISNS